jgi:SPP1 family phage portal protein
VNLVAISYSAGAVMNEKQFLEQEIRAWKGSVIRGIQIKGEEYYQGKHDILKRKRQVIGDEGRLVTVENLPNNRLVDNQYAKMVDQKTNYLLGKPFKIQTDNKAYEEALMKVFDKRFHRTLQNLGEDSLNCGIGWLYVYYDEDGKFKFKRFRPWEVMPLWKDAEHTALNCVIRLYEVEVYEGAKLSTVEKVEVYKTTGIDRYNISSNGSLTPDDTMPSSNYVVITDDSGESTGYNWGRIPIIAFKYNDEEIPMICKVKTLQDSINTMLSDFQNNMQEDARNTILVIKNYDGQDLGEFRRNLAMYGVVKVCTADGGDGGVDTLQVEVNAENYKASLDLLKKALIENAMGYDAKDDRLSGNPNQMNILSMYSDIDLDANGMETEWQASFEDLLFFVNAHLANTRQGDFEGEEVDVVFNRDIMMNESDVINNIRNSVGILSNETLIAKNPWVTDVDAELRRIQTDKEATLEYQNEFITTGGGTGEEA